VGDVITVGQVIARADISVKLEELTSDSHQDIKVLTQELQEVQLELAETQGELTQISQEKQRTEEKLNRLSKEPLLVSDFVRLRNSHDVLEKDSAQLQEKIAGLHRKALQLQEKKTRLSEFAARERTLFEQEAAIQASFSGKILRIDRHSEGEKIRLSVLYQQGTE
jgi:chromosome segregation ATPase